MEFLLLDLELPGLKSKLTCVHSRLRPNVCFYLKVSFHVLGTIEELFNQFSMFEVIVALPLTILLTLLLKAACKSEGHFLLQM